MPVFMSQLKVKAISILGRHDDPPERCIHKPVSDDVSIYIQVKVGVTNIYIFINYSVLFLVKILEPLIFIIVFMGVLWSIPLLVMKFREL